MIRSLGSSRGTRGRCRTNWRRRGGVIPKGQGGDSLEEINPGHVVRTQTAKWLGSRPSPTPATTVSAQAMAARLDLDASMRLDAGLGCTQQKCWNAMAHVHGIQSGTSAGHGCVAAAGTCSVSLPSRGTGADRRLTFRHPAVPLCNRLDHSLPERHRPRQPSLPTRTSCLDPAFYRYSPPAMPLLAWACSGRIAQCNRAGPLAARVASPFPLRPVVVLQGQPQPERETLGWLGPPSGWAGGRDPSRAVGRTCPCPRAPVTPC